MSPPLLDRQRQAVVLGAIRIGTQVRGNNGKMRPEKLSTFRLTSPDAAKIEAAAALYGGEVRPWKPSENAGQQWEVITTVDRMAVRVPPGEPVEQDYTLYGGRPVVRQRLCDGFTERMRGGTCQCPPDLMDRKRLAAEGQACKPTTHLSLILADLPGLGVWRLTSRGDAAADELAATAELLRRSEVVGVMLPATLVLEQRQSTGSGEVHKFAVPRLDVGETLAALEAGTYQRAGIAAGREQVALPPSPPVEPVEPLPPPVGAVADPAALSALAGQAATPDEVKALRAEAKRRDWLGEHVPGSDDVWEPLENVLYERYCALGGRP